MISEADGVDESRANLESFFNMVYNDFCGKHSVPGEDPKWYILSAVTSLNSHFLQENKKIIIFPIVGFIF
jgi:hypothetical protein